MRRPRPSCPTRRCGRRARRRGTAPARHGTPTPLRSRPGEGGRQRSEGPAGLEQTMIRYTRFLSRSTCDSWSVTTFGCPVTFPYAVISLTNSESLPVTDMILIAYSSPVSRCFAILTTPHAPVPRAPSSTNSYLPSGVNIFFGGGRSSANIPTEPHLEPHLLALEPARLLAPSSWLPWNLHKGEEAVWCAKCGLVTAMASTPLLGVIPHERLHH